MSQYVVITPDGRRFGPTDFQTLSQWAIEGRVAPGMTVEDLLSGQRMVAGSVPGLFGSAAPYPRPIATPSTNSSGAVGGLALGIIGLIAWCLPIIGFPVGLIAVILSARAMKGENRGLAVVGLVLGILCLLLSIANGILGAIFAVNKTFG